MPAAAPQGASVMALPVTLLIQIAATAAVMAPAVAAPRLLATFGVGVSAVGAYIALVYFGALVSSQWGATLVRRWGPIRVSQAALAVCAVGLLVFCASDLRIAIAGAVVLGLGYGTITPASSDILARSAHPRHYALVFSAKQTGVPLGGALAGLLVPVALEHWGSTWALAQISVLCLVSMVLAQPLRASLDAHRDPASVGPRLSQMTHAIRFVLANPATRLLAWCTLVFSGIQVAVTSYLVSFLNTTLGWSLVAAGAAMAALQASGAVGRVAWGLAADRWLGDRKTLLVLGCTIGALSVGLSQASPTSSHAGVTLLLVVYGAAVIGCGGVLLAAFARQVPPGQAALATSGSLFFSYLGVMAGPLLFGSAGTRLGNLGWAFALLALPSAVTVWLLWTARWSAPGDRSRP